MQNFGVTNKEHYGMLFYFCSGHDKRWYTTKLLVSLEIPRGMKFPGRVGEGGGGTHFYAILGCTAVQGMVLDPSALNRAWG